MIAEQWEQERLENDSSRLKRSAEKYFHVKIKMVCRDLLARFRCAKLMFSPRSAILRAPATVLVAP